MNTSNTSQISQTQSYQSGEIPDRHLRSLLKKLDDDIHEFEYKYPKFSKRAKYDFKQKFEQFESYLAIYISSKKNYNQAQSSVYKKYIINDYLKFPPVDIKELIIHPSYQQQQNHNDALNSLTNNNNDHSTPQQGLKQNTISQHHVSCFEPSQQPSPFSPQKKSPTKIRKTIQMSKRSGSKDTHSNIFSQSVNSPLQSLQEHQSSPIILHDHTKSITYRETYFLEKIKALYQILRDVQNGPHELTKNFEQMPEYQKKVKQLELIHQKDKENPENTTRFQDFNYLTTPLLDFQELEPSLHFQEGQLSPQNVEYLEKFQQRHDCIYFIYFKEKQENLTYIQINSDQNNGGYVQKLRVGYTANILATVEYDLLPNIGEFYMFNVFAGNRIDEQQFNDFMNVYLLNLKTGPDFAINTASELGFYYSQEIVEFVQNWFKYQIEGNKDIHCPVYNLVRQEQYDKIQAECQRLLGVINEKDSEISQLKTVIDTRDRKIEILEKLIENNKREIQNQKEELQQKEEQIEDKEKIIGYQEKDLKEKQQTIDKLNEELEEVRQTYARKTVECEEQTKKIEELEIKLLEQGSQNQALQQQEQQQQDEVAVIGDEDQENFEI